MSFNQKRLLHALVATVWVLSGVSLLLGLNLFGGNEADFLLYLPLGNVMLFVTVGPSISEINEHKEGK